MVRYFTIINFALVLSLAGTCLVQWRQERTYGARVTELQKENDRQQNKIEVQADDLRRTNEDLAGFKETVAKLTADSESQAADLRQQRARVLQLENEKGRLSRELAAWQQAVEEHKAALSARDENIQKLVDRLQQVTAAQRDAADKANRSISAYNQLVTKYEDVVGRYNTLVTQYKAEHPAPPPN